MLGHQESYLTNFKVLKRKKEVWTKVKTHHFLLKENDEFLILN